MPHRHDAIDNLLDDPALGRLVSLFGKRDSERIGNVYNVTLCERWLRLALHVANRRRRLFDCSRRINEHLLRGRGGVYFFCGLSPWLFFHWLGARSSASSKNDIAAIFPPIA